MAKRKICYRIQVGSGLGLISKCMVKKRAERFQRSIDYGGMISLVFKDKPKNKNDWVR